MALPHQHSAAELSNFEDVKALLRQELDTRSQPFAICESLPGGISPFLRHHTVGPIDLPLTEDCTNKLCPVRASSSLGCTSNISIVSAEHLEVTSPSFLEEVESIAKVATKDLGLPDKYQTPLPLHKLMLFEKGKPQPLTLENDSKIAGFLAIFLKTPHEGGGVTLSLGKDSLKVSPSPFYSDWACWHRNVQLSLSEIEFGHIACLLYSLSETAETPSNLSPTSRVESALRAWTSDESMQSELIHVLNHDYSTTHCGLDDLIGSDASNASQLVALSNELGYKVFLAQMQLTIKKGGGKHGYDWNEFERSLRLQQVHDLAGFPLGMKSIDIEDDLVIQEEVWDRDPDEEEEQDWEDELRSDDIYYDSVSLARARY